MGQQTRYYPTLVGGKRAACGGFRPRVKLRYFALSASEGILALTIRNAAQGLGFSLEFGRSFLRGAGVPENFITYMKSLAGTENAFEFYSCFISYSTKDQDFADRLYADLQARGVRCWFAPHDVKAGRKLHEQIDEAIRLCERLLMILSPSSMDRERVKTEIAKARKREVGEKRRVLFPIRLAPFEALRDSGVLRRGHRQRLGAGDPRVLHP